MPLIAVSAQTLDRLRRLLRGSAKEVRGAGIAQVVDLPDSTTIYVPPPARSVGDDAQATVTLVRVQQDGGAAGDQFTACTWTYSLWPSSGTFGATETRIATLRAPLYRPVRPAAYVAAASGSYGLATYQNSEYVLLIAYGEYVAGDPCPA